MSKKLHIQLEDPIYQCFLAEFTHEVQKNWHRQRNALAIEAKVSSSLITDIIDKKTKASFEKRSALVGAMGREYLEFIERGRTKILSYTETPGSGRTIKQPTVSLSEKLKSQVESPGEIETETQGDKELQTIVNRFLDMQEKHESRIKELEAKIDKLQEENLQLRLAQHRSPAKQGREQDRTPDKQTANGQ